MLRLNTLLNEYNNAGCPVDAHGDPIGTVAGPLGSLAIVKG